MLRATSELRMMSILNTGAIFPMGEDSAELLVRVEEEFNIDLSETDVAHIATVGDLYNLLLSKLENDDACRSSRAFYRLRKTIVDCLGLPRKAIRPTTKLEAFLPEENRVALWGQLESASHLTFPKLRHPRWMRDAIRTIALVATIVFQFLVARWLHPHGIYWAPMIFADIAVWIAVRQILYAATPSMAREFPFKTMRTVGDLSQYLLRTHFTVFKPEGGDAQACNKKEVWEQLRYLVYDFVGVDASEVTPETRFIEDLKMD